MGAEHADITYVIWISQGHLEITGRLRPQLLAFLALGTAEFRPIRDQEFTRLYLFESLTIKFGRSAIFSDGAYDILWHPGWDFCFDFQGNLHFRIY